VYRKADGGVIRSANTKTSTGFTNEFVEGMVMKRNNNGCRLPTEAEWEFAARGGKTDEPDWAYPYAGQQTASAYNSEGAGAGGKTTLTSGTNGPYQTAWHRANAQQINGNSADASKALLDYGIHPAGTKAPNRLGLYDMTGNVFEWCWDFGSTAGTDQISSEFYAASQTDPVGPITDWSEIHSVRGGGWTTHVNDLGVTRQEFRDETNKNYIGFRIVRKAEGTIYK
jgi:formylglycine-generating enzyme required for sulfatase activity